MDFSHLFQKNLPEYIIKPDNINNNKNDNNNLDNSPLPNFNSIENRQSFNDLNNNNNNNNNNNFDNLNQNLNPIINNNNYNNNNLNSNIIGNFNYNGINNFDESNDDTKARNRRRSKNDNDGRSHKCNVCGKAYLSYPALYTHVKTKHDSQEKNGNKGRGRPKKESGEGDSLKQIYSPATFDYFKNPEKNGETDNIKDICKTVFDDFYTMSLTMLCKEKYKNTLDNFQFEDFEKERATNNSSITLDFFKIIENYRNVDNYTFYKNLFDYFECPQLVEDSAACDNVFYFYLYKVSKLVNERYFIVVLKFVTLFREFVNLIYKKKVPENILYTEKHNPEDVPDISNEFMIDFLGTEDLLFGYSREEGIELTQNLCMWLYDNNYTCSKVSLINGYS